MIQSLETRRLLVGVSIALALALGAGAQDSAGDRLYAQGRFEKALAAYRASMKAGKGGVAGAGRCLIRLNRVLEAVKLLEPAVDEGTADPVVQVVLGQALYWNGLSFQANDPAFAMTRFEQAVSRCQTALEQNPKLGEAYRVIGKIRLAQNNTEDAHVALRKAIEVDPEDGMNHFEWAQTLYRDKRYADAAPVYDTAARAFGAAGRKKLQRDALVGAAYALDVAGDPDNARRAFEEAFRLDPANASMFQGIWSLYGTRKERQAAGIALLQALSKAKASAPYPKLYLGHFYRAAGRSKKAKSTWLALAKSSQGRKLADVHALLGEMALLDDDDEARAEKYLFKAFKIDRQNSVAMTLLQRLTHRFQRARDWSAAIDITKKFLKVQPKRASAWAALAGYYHTAGRLRDAEPHYKKAMKLDPKNPQWSANAAKMYNDMNRNAEAEKMWKHSLGIRPNHVETLMNLGWFYKRMGRFAEAKDTFAKILEIQPDHMRAAREHDIVTRRLARKKKS